MGTLIDQPLFCVKTGELRAAQLPLRFNRVRIWFDAYES